MTTQNKNYHFFLLILNVLSAIILWKIWLYAAAHYAPLFILFDSHSTLWGQYNEKYPFLVWIWSNFDGQHYLEIASRGYHDLQNSFFPLYPFLIWLLHKSTNLPFLISAQLISNLSLLASLYLLWLLLKKDGLPQKYLFLLAVLFTFPTSLYYMAVYNDALFFFLACLCLYFGRNKKWLLAGVIGALATLARLNGLALFFFLSFEYLFDEENIARQWQFTEWKRKIQSIFTIPFWKKVFSSGSLFVLLIPSAFAGYLLYTQIYFLSWYKIFSAMSIWKQDRTTFPIQVLWRYFKIILLHPEFAHFNYWIAVLELSATCLYLFLLFFSWKKIRLSYWIFFAVSILIPAMTGTFQGMPRYGLHLYPFFLSLALFLSTFPKWTKAMYFIAAALALAGCAMLFTSGYFIA